MTLNPAEQRNFQLNSLQFGYDLKKLQFEITKKNNFRKKYNNNFLKSGQVTDKQNKKKITIPGWLRICVSLLAVHLVLILLRPEKICFLRGLRWIANSGNSLMALSVFCELENLVPMVKWRQCISIIGLISYANTFRPFSTNCLAKEMTWSLSVLMFFSIFSLG